MKLFDKSGFTLSELLITMSIVGVIAVLTVPNVMRNIFKDSYYTKALATQEIVSKAISQMLVSERLTDLEDSSLLTNKGDFFKNYIKLTKNCNTTHTGCFADTYISGLSSSEHNVNISGLYSAKDKYYTIFANGAAVAALTGGNVPSGEIYFLVDVNGKSAPNTYGIDMFTFSVNLDGSVSELE